MLLSSLLHGGQCCRGLSRSQRDVLLIVTGSIHDLEAIAIAERLNKVSGVNLQVRAHGTKGVKALSTCLLPVCCRCGPRVQRLKTYMILSELRW